MVLLAYTHRRDLAEVAAARLSRALGPGCPVAAAASVNGQRWVRLDRPDHGTVGQDKRDLFAAESLYRDGAVPYRSQAEHRASFGPGADLIPPEVMAAATQAAVQAVGSVEGASVERAWVGVMLDGTAATGKRLSDVDAARLLADVQHTDFRDHAWAAMERQQAAQHAELLEGPAGACPGRRRGARGLSGCLRVLGLGRRTQRPRSARSHPAGAVLQHGRADLHGTARRGRPAAHPHACRAAEGDRVLDNVRAHPRGEAAEEAASTPGHRSGPPERASMTPAALARCPSIGRVSIRGCQPATPTAAGRSVVLAGVEVVAESGSGQRQE